ncbi:hypothetical protein ACFDAU_12275 [Sulfuriferula sp. GW1]|uniref:hypothetical protein n=1 Tax=Sulfuriferula sp. GW1 TaxID=3345111 RepID=UPI0039B02706
MTSFACKVEDVGCLGKQLATENAMLMGNIQALAEAPALLKSSRYLSIRLSEYYSIVFRYFRKMNRSDGKPIQDYQIHSNTLLVQGKQHHEYESGSKLK